MKRTAPLILMLIGMFGFEQPCFSFGFIKKAASAVSGAARDVGKEVKKGAKTVVKTAEEAGKKIIQCAQVGTLSTQAAAQATASKVADTILKGAEGAIKIAGKTLDGAKATLSAADAVQKGLIDTANEAQKGVLRASDAVQKAGMQVAKGSLAIAAKLTDLTAEAIAQGFNIKKVFFEASFADLASGKLPKAMVEGAVFGQSFSFKLDADFADIESLAEKIINKVFG